MKPVLAGPDIVGADFTGWWVYVLGPLIGASIAVMLIGLVGGCPTRRSARPPREAPCPCRSRRASSHDLGLTRQEPSLDSEGYVDQHEHPQQADLVLIR